ncbi:MAG: cation:dicarboxylase symporter family transporter, partial [Rickettsiales bacterium]
MTAPEADQTTADDYRKRSLLPFADSMQQLLQGKLWLQVLVGMVLGVGTGVTIGPSAGLVAPETAIVVGNWLGFPGQLFLALIQMIVMPLVFASIVRGLCSTDDLGQLCSMGARAVSYFVVTTAVTVAIGIWLAILIEPGDFIDAASIRQSLASEIPLGAAGAVSTPSLQELPRQFLTLLPSNPLSSMVESNMLQIVIFACVVGVALVMMEREKGKPMLDVLAALQEVCMTVVKWAMWLAPWA